MGNLVFRTKTQAAIDQSALVYRIDDGTDHANEITALRLPDGTQIIHKVMLTSHKYHQRRKALAEMVHALLDEGLGAQRVVADTYAEVFRLSGWYARLWGERPREPERARVCQVVHTYLPGVPGDEWRGQVYRETGDLAAADRHCQAVIEAHPDAERIALLDFLTINQDRSARNWLTDRGQRFWAIDNGMAWFHEYPYSDEWQIGCVIDDVLLQTQPWQFISGVFTTSYAGRPLSAALFSAVLGFSWGRFAQGLDLACDWLGLPPLSEDWRFLGLARRLAWIKKEGRFPTASEYRTWHRGSPLMTPPEIVATGGNIIWTQTEDRP